MKTYLPIFLVVIFSLNVKGQIPYENNMDTTKSARYIKGWEKLCEIDGKAGQNVIQSLEVISPNLSNYVIEYPFGDVYCRDILNDREREIAVVAALTALGNARPQLKVHINAALNVGVSVDELKEIMILMSVYSGFPTALNGTFALEEVLKERSEN